MIVGKSITSVHEDNPIPLNLLNTFIHSLIDATIRFGTPISQSILILPDDFRGSISRSSINNDIFQQGIILSQYALDGLGDQASTIERDSYDTKRIFPRHNYPFSFLRKRRRRSSGEAFQLCAQRWIT